MRVAAFCFLFFTLVSASAARSDGESEPPGMPVPVSENLQDNEGTYFILPDRHMDGNRLTPGVLGVDRHSIVPAPGPVRWIYPIPATVPTWWILDEGQRWYEVTLGEHGPSLQPLRDPPTDARGDITDIPPALIQVDGVLLEVDTAGLIEYLVGAEMAKSFVPLPDAQPSISPGGLVAVLGSPTGAYPHGIMGDRLEAESIFILDPTAGEVRNITAVQSVYEERGVLWTTDAEGQDILVTVTSNQRNGSSIVGYRADGIEIPGTAIGTGFRWKHLVGAIPLPSGHGRRIVAVKTPHIGGVVEVLEVAAGQLQLAAERSGYSTHDIGERNLGMVALVDVTGDGSAEILAPDQSKQHLVGLRIDGDEMEEVWSADLGARIISNIAIAGTGNGLAAIAGTADGMLHFFW